MAMRGSVFFAIALSACTSAPAGRPPECEEIAERCHPFTTPAAMECHESSESTWTAAECSANLATCFTECTEPTDAGAADAGAADAGANDAGAADAAGGDSGP